MTWAWYMGWKLGLSEEKGFFGILVDQVTMPRTKADVTHY
jgi:hypothetical protein